jgi:hypothetical protein
VSYEEIDTDLETLTAARDKDSVQAVRNGCGTGHKREGIVLRPLVELTTSDGERVIVKYKTEDFMETNTPRPVDDSKLQVLTDAAAIAEEWVTERRMVNILSHWPENEIRVERTPQMISAMQEDVVREAGSEIVVTPVVLKAIAKVTAVMFKKRVSRI